MPPKGRQAGAKKVRRKEKKNVAQGEAHIKSTFNNTIVTITDPHGVPARCRGIQATTSSMTTSTSMASTATSANPAPVARSPSQAMTSSGMAARCAAIYSGPRTSAIACDSAMNSGTEPLDRQTEAT